MQEKGNPLGLCYGVAVLLVAITLVIRWLVSPVLGPYLLMMFLVAVTLSAWYGGLGPGLLATTLIALTSTFLLPPPLGHWLSLTEPHGTVRLALFSSLGVIISFLFDALKSEAARRQCALNQLEAERARFHAFMAYSPMISFIKNARGNYLFVSEPARARFGLAPEEAIGKTAFDLFPSEVAQQLSSADASVLATGLPAETIEALPSADGVLRHWLVVKFPFRDAAGEALLGAVGIDITARKQAEEQLKQSERRLNEAQRVARIGSWERDLRTNEVTWSQELYRLFGINPEEAPVTYAEFLRLVHPDDRDRIQTLLADAQRLRQPFHYEYRIVLPDGRIRVMYDHADLMLNAEGEPVRFIGTCQDITERQQAEEQLKQSERRLNEAQRVARIGSWERDLRTGEVTWSQELYRLFGLNPQEGSLTYEWFLSLVHPDDRSRLRTLVEATLRDRQPLDTHYRIVLPNGRVRVLHDRADLILNEQGEPIRMIGTCLDITERQQAEEQLALARRRILEAEVEKKHFTREVLRATTNDKLHVVEPDEIPHAGQVVADVPLDDPESYSQLRQQLRTIAAQAGMSPEQTNNLLLATSEAATNAIKHASGGRAIVLVNPEQVIVRVTDTGHGIRPEDLPATVLRAGFSTKVSLGMGFTMILETTDRIWLATGPDGTVLQLANWIHPEQHLRDPLLAILDRF